MRKIYLIAALMAMPLAASAQVKEAKSIESADMEGIPKEYSYNGNPYFSITTEDYYNKCVKSSIYDESISLVRSFQIDGPRIEYKYETLQRANNPELTRDDEYRDQWVYQTFT